MRQVVLSSLGDGFAVTVDGRTRYVQAARIGVNSLSLMVGEVWPKGDTAAGRRPNLRRIERRRSRRGAGPYAGLVDGLRWTP